MTEENGTKGQVEAFDEKEGRYRILVSKEIRGSNLVQARPKNLAALTRTPSPNAKQGQTLEEEASEAGGPTP